MSSEIILPAENREASIQRVVAYLSKCRPGHKLRVEVSEVRRGRSGSQNASLWGVAYPPLMAHMGLRGEREAEELHEFWCGEYFGWVTYDIMGQRKKRPRRTTTTDEMGQRKVIATVEFMDFYAFIQQRSAEYGVFVPDPDPEWFRGETGAAA